MGSYDIRFKEPPAPREQLILYSQSVDDAVPPDAEVRHFAALMDEVDWRPWEAAYEGYGQPPIHPRYLASAILFGLMNRVYSTRDLEYAAARNLDFIWLLEGFTPDHSTFANFQARHDRAIEDLNRQVAGMLVRGRKRALLALLVDGTRMQANSERGGARTAESIQRALEELNRRLDRLRASAQRAPETACFEGMAPEEDAEEALARVSKEIKALLRKQAQYEKALGVARERDKKARKHNGKKARSVPVPVTDPEAQVLPNKDGGFAPNYTPVAAVDAETGAILHADIAEGSDEAGTVQPAVESAQKVAGQTPDTLAADGNFASGEVLKNLAEKEIDAYMPTHADSPPDNPALRPDPSVPVSEEDIAKLPADRNGVFKRSAFVYDAAADCYYCPMGQAMWVYRRGLNRGVVRGHYRGRSCEGCPLAPRCLKKGSAFRTIVRDEYEHLREATAERMATPEGKAVYAQRAPGIERVFAHVKGQMGIRQFRRRGKEKIRAEWQWICAGLNTKHLLAQCMKIPGANPLNALRTLTSNAAGVPNTISTSLSSFCRRVVSSAKRPHNWNPSRIHASRINLVPQGS